MDAGSNTAKRALDEGYIVVFDIKDGLEIESDQFFKRDECAFDLCRDTLYAQYVEEPSTEDPDSEPLRMTESPDELALGFKEHSINWMFFSLAERFDKKSLEDVMGVCKTYCFFPPEYVIHKGSVVYSL